MNQKKLLPSFSSIVWSVLAAVVVGIAIAVTDVASWLPIFLFGTATLFTVGPILFIILSKKGRVDIFAPVFVFNITILLHFILPSVDYFSPLSNYPADLLSKALAVVIAFTLLFHLGYYVASKQHPNENKKQTADQLRKTPKHYNHYIIIVGIVFFISVSLFAEWRMLSAIGGISSLMRIMRSRLAMFDYISGVTLTMIRFARPAFFLALFLIFMQSEKIPLRYIVLAVITGFLAILVGVFTGNRGDFISPLLTLMVFYHYRKRRIPITYALIFMAASVIFLPLYLVFVRNTNMQAEMLGMGLTEKIGYLFNDAFGEGTFMEIRSVMDVIRGVPGILPYQWGKTYFALLTSFIPRSIFPNKLPEAATVFNLAFYPERWLAGGGGARVSMIGELYMNFGLIGLSIGGVFLGWLMRKIYNIFPNRNDLTSLLFYAIALPVFYFIVRGNFVGVAVHFLVDWIPTWFIISLAARLAHSTNTAPSRSTYFSESTI